MPVGLAVHWEGTGNVALDHVDCPRQLAEIEAYHQAKGLGDNTAYNFLFCRHGAVFDGKGWGFHGTAGMVCYANGTTQANRDYFAACYMSGGARFDDDGNRIDDWPFTPEAQHAAWTIWQDAQARGLGDLQPHATFFATECPGSDLKAWVAAGAPDSTVTPEPTPPGGPVAEKVRISLVDSQEHEVAVGWVIGGMPMMSERGLLDAGGHDVPVSYYTSMPKADWDVFWAAFTNPPLIAKLVLDQMSTRLQA